VKLLGAGGADEGGRDGGLVQGPGQRDLGGAAPEGGRRVADGGQYCPVSVGVGALVGIARGGSEPAADACCSAAAVSAGGGYFPVRKPLASGARLDFIGRA